MSGHTPPNPGSPDAIKAGCTCPRMDNGNGRGYRDGLYVRDAECPLHGMQTGNTDIHDPEAT